MGHHHGPDQFSLAYWDERYGSADRVWSGRPNAQLVRFTESLAPGRALEAGSGEGADAVWLASRGWQVTGLDISPVGLAKAAEHAAEAGVADRVRWQQADFHEWVADDERYDLVTAQFAHLPLPSTWRLHQQLAASVAPGGTLLVVGHHPVDERPTATHGEEHPDVRFTAEDAASRLDATQWSSIETLTVERPGHDHDGASRVWHDAVLVAVRR